MDGSWRGRYLGLAWPGSNRISQAPSSALQTAAQHRDTLGVGPGLSAKSHRHHKTTSSYAYRGRKTSTKKLFKIPQTNRCSGNRRRRRRWKRNWSRNREIKIENENGLQLPRSSPSLVVVSCRQELVGKPTQRESGAKMLQMHRHWAKINVTWLKNYLKIKYLFYYIVLSLKMIFKLKSNEQNPLSI